MAMCFLYLGLGSWEPSTFTSYFGLQNPRPDRSIQECKPLCSTLANRNVQNWTWKKLWRPEVRRLKQSCAKICKSNILYKSWNLTIACMIIYAICIYYNRYFIRSFSLRWHWPPRWPPSPQVAIKKVLIFDPDQKKRLDTEAAIMKAGLGEPSRKAASWKVHQMHCWRQDLDHPHICKLMETYEKGSCLAIISQIFWGASDCSHAFNFHFLDAWWVIPNCLGSSRESVDWLQLCCSGGSIYMMYICVFSILKKWLMSIHWRFFRLWA